MISIKTLFYKLKLDRGVAFDKIRLLLVYIATVAISFNGLTQHTRRFDNVAIACILVTMAWAFLIEKQRVSKIHWALLLSTLIFAFAFWIESSPAPTYLGESTVKAKSWWFEMSTGMIAVICLGMLIRFKREALILLGLFCLVPTVLEGFTVIYGLIKGGAVNSVVISPFSVEPVSPAGLSNQLIYFPAFYAIYLIFRAERPRTLEIILLAGFLLLVGIECYLCKKRSPFVILIIYLPLLLAYRRQRGRFGILRKSLISGSVALGMVFLFVLMGYHMRGIGNLFHDPRFEFYRSFLHQLIHHPFQRAVLDVSFQKQWGVWWFHNFFADVHRSSGFVPFVMSIGLIGFIGMRAAYYTFMKSGDPTFLALFCFAFLFLNTSVVPEGEAHPLMLVLLLGSIVEMLLSHASLPKKEELPCN